MLVLLVFFLLETHIGERTPKENSLPLMVVQHQTYYLTALWKDLENFFSWCKIQGFPGSYSADSSTYDLPDNTVQKFLYLLYHIFI